MAIFTMPARVCGGDLAGFVAALTARNSIPR